MSYSNFGKFLIVASAVFVFPILILAESGGQSAGEAAGEKSGVLGNFCKKVNESGSKIEQKIADLEAKLAEKRAQSANKISQLQSDRDKKLIEKRAEWDLNRDKIYAGLEAKASTLEQKQAAESFKEAVEQAVFVRRAAIDGAINDFRYASGQIFTDRKAAADQAVLNYKIAVKNALNEAQTDCQEGEDNETVRKNLISGLKTARENFNAGKSGIEKPQISVQEIRQIKKEAIERAIADFKSALTEAKEGLKKVFPDAE